MTISTLAITFQAIRWILNIISIDIGQDRVLHIIREIWPAYEIVCHLKGPKANSCALYFLVSYFFRSPNCGPFIPLDICTFAWNCFIYLFIFFGCCYFCSRSIMIFICYCCFCRMRTNTHTQTYIQIRLYYHVCWSAVLRLFHRSMPFFESLICITKHFFSLSFSLSQLNTSSFFQNILHKVREREREWVFDVFL